VRFGIEYTYPYWQFNGSHARLTPTSTGEETRKISITRNCRFQHWGLKVVRQLNQNLIVDAADNGS
jgi:hypothetical protein